MTRSPLRRKIAALALATALVTSWASAAEPSRHSTQGSLAQLWNHLVILTSDIGCWIDPNGRCATNTVTPDIGCRLDPDGRCATGTVAPDIGCTADPDGRCATGKVTPDIGCRLDPNGLCAPGS